MLILHVLPQAARAYVAALRQLAGAGAAHLRELPRDELEDARERLLELAQHARHKQTDLQGRQLWRSPAARAQGYGMRWVVDPRVSPGELPRLLWVGFRAPPRAVWEAQS